MLRPLLLLTITLQLFMPCICNAESEHWRNRLSDEEVVTSADIAAEITFGRAIAARILGKHLFCDIPALNKYINLVGNTLALSSNRPELEFHFMVLDTDELNSFAAPGGYVFITRGSLELMQDESELAGVLAHEIAHISTRNIVKELNIKGADDASDLAKLISGGSGAVRAALQANKNYITANSKFSTSVQNGFDLIYMNEYRIEDEMQADRTAVIISALSGYDPSGLANYLIRTKQTTQKVTATSSSTQLLTDVRVSLIKEAIANDGINDLILAKNVDRFTEQMMIFKNQKSIH